jgi:D-alanyl-lipoteichoic acid acyltransferase DltB (MBOAT superfamily)
MQPGTFSFFFFIAATVALCFVVPKRGQWLVLLAASLAYYMTFAAAAPIWLAVTILATWGGALRLEKLNTAAKAQAKDSPERARLTKEKKLWLAAVVAVDLGLLVALKYRGLWAGGSIIAPLGISFYTMTAIGYAVDVFRGRLPAERNVLRVALFLTLFLQIVQGPFLRYGDMGPKLRAPLTFDYDRLRRGAVRVLWGAMKKAVIAERLGGYVQAALSDPSRQGAPVMLIALCVYSVQIYADFSGYMDMILGAGDILGLTLPENFENPLSARSVSDFWRRWHITLGAWFKDYVFYPISVSGFATQWSRKLRKDGKLRLAKLLPALLGLAVVWPLTGLWHGATWNFLLWGLLNGVAITLSLATEPWQRTALARLRIRPESRGFKAFQVIRTFLLLTLIRAFSRTDTLPQALEVLRYALAPDRANGFQLFPVGMGVEYHFLLALALSVLMLLIERTGKPREILDRFDALGLPLKYAVSLSLLYVVLIFGALGRDPFSGFLYAGF